MIILPTDKNFRFDEDQHRYFYNNKEIMGVTSILKAGNLLDLSFVKTDLLKQACDFGTAVHKMTELCDLGTLDFNALDPILRPYLDAWIRFKSESACIIEHIEAPVYSKRHNYMGTLDRVANFGTKRSIVDIKSGLVYPSQAIQLAGYLEAFNEDLPYKERAQDRMVVRLKEDGTYSLPKKEFFKTTDFGIFKACLTIAKWKRAS